MRIRNKTVGLAALLTLLVLATFAGVASAQLTGVVTASSGITLEGVAIEAWSGDRRLAAVLSDADGRFSFPEIVANQTVMLRAGALGFEVLEVVVVEGVDSYDLRLAEAPLLLEGLVVSTEEAPCERRRDDPVARTLWEQARSRYHGIMDTLGIATYLAEADTVVPIEKLGPLQLPVLNLSQRGSSSLLRFSWTRRIEREGYAFKVRRTDGGIPTTRGFILRSKRISLPTSSMICSVSAIASSWTMCARTVGVSPTALRRMTSLASRG